MSAYMMWLHGTKEQVKAENPGIKATEGAALMSTLWRTLDKSEKSKWEEKAAKAKEQYEKDIELYNAATEGSVQ